MSNQSQPEQTICRSALQAHREARDLTRQQLAAQLGRAETTIKRWERIGWAPPEVWAALRG